MMKNRPKIDIELEGIDHAMEWAGFALVVLTWAWVIYCYPTLPDTIPTHYNAIGEVDGFGSKPTLLILPVLATVLFAGLLLLSRKPRLYNYPVSVTPENARKLYKTGSRAIRYIALFIPIIFGIIIYSTIQTARGEMQGIGKWFLPFAIIGTTAPTILMLIRISKIKSADHADTTIKK